jgi:NitT/TauT family transport system substrate-binding protein
MNESTEHGFSRREFLAGTSMLGAATLLGLPRTAAAEPPPETTRIRLAAVPAICVAPQYVAEALLKAEGFTDVQYVKFDKTIAGAEIWGLTDMSLAAVQQVIMDVDSALPILVLAGVHLGCYELFGGERVRSIRDLKGKTVPVDNLGGAQHALLSSMAAYVGLDPRKDIHWVVTSSSAEAMQLFVDAKVDAFLGFPPEPQELRARGVGHVVVNTAVDKPWSQYFCCMLVGNRDFVQKHPIATKRALRAILRAADLCAQ